MAGDRSTKSKRTRTGCLTCRARKVKCDERPGTCRNCERVVLQCRWPELRDIVGPDGNGRRERPSSAAASRTAADMTPGSIGDASPSRRNGAPCTACFLERYQCSQTRPACQRCAEQELDCSYPSETSPDQKPVIDQESPYVQSVVLNKETILAHLEGYFIHVHPVSINGFLHPETTRQRLETGRIDRKLLLAICAVASPFLRLEPSFAAALQPDAWAREAKTRLIIDAEINMDSLATALILARHDISSGRYGSAWLLTSMANRIALSLGLHKEPPEDMPFILAESCRRLYWACFCLDRMMSTGVRDFITTSADRVHLRLPADEHEFTLGLAVQTRFADFINLQPYFPLDQCQSMGLLAHYVFVSGMRYEARSLHCNRSKDERLPPWDPDSRFARAARQMAAWRRSLAPQYELNADTMYAKRDCLTQLIMVHIWYDMCMLDLYRVVMPGFPESTVEPAPEPWATRTRQACVAHAKGIANTLRLVHVHFGPNFVCLDSSLPFVVLESARIRVTDVFMSPLQDQAAILAEMTDDFTHMMGFVERMKPYFNQAVWLHKEMLMMLRRHGIIVRQGSEDSTVDGTTSADDATRANHPWQNRMRKLGERDKAISAMTMQSLDFLFASSLSTSQIPPLTAATIEGLSSPLESDFAPPSFDGGAINFGEWMAPGYIPPASVAN